MELGLKDKVVLVTGGTHGIGLATALEFAKEGCKVAVCSRTAVRVEQSLAELRSIGYPAMAIEADVRKKTDIENVIASVVHAWGTIDILVNNAGGGGRWGSVIVEETDEDVWAEVYQTNAIAAMRFTMSVIPYMRKQRWGRVITITSIHGKEGGGRPWFAMAKTAQTSMMKSLSQCHYLVREGITFNSVAPGSIMIPNTGWETMQKENPREFEKLMDEQYPMGRLGIPKEISAVVVFLASERASLINGAAISVDGGESRHF